MLLKKRSLVLLSVMFVTFSLSARNFLVEDSLDLTFNLAVPVPVKVNATDAKFYDKIIVGWQSSQEGLIYRVFTYDRNNNLLHTTDWEPCKMNVCSRTIGKNKTLKPGEPYYFAVQAAINSKYKSAISSKDHGSLNSYAAPNLITKKVVKEAAENPKGKKE